MRTVAYLAGALATLITLTACNALTGGNAPSTPTSPTTQLPPTSPTTQLPPTNPSPAAPRGEITVRTLTPASPATLIVRECTYPNSAFNDMCSSQLQMAFDVQFENEISNAVVTAAFYAGSQRCGLAASSRQPFAAGGRATFSVPVISLSDESTLLLCALPAVTTRMVVQLWEASRPAVPLLTKDFVNTYMFVEP